MEREAGLSPFAELTLTNTSPVARIPSRKLTWGAAESPAATTPRRNILCRPGSPTTLKLSARGNLIRRMNSAPSPTTMSLADTAGKENAYLLQHCPMKVSNSQPDEHDTCSQDSGCAEDNPTEVRFAVPSGFAPKKSIEPSPSKTCLEGGDLCSPSRPRRNFNILCSPVNIRSPRRILKSLSFSSTDSLDDGFSDLAELETQDENAPIALGSLLTGQLLTTNEKGKEEDAPTPTAERLPLRRAFSLAENNILTPTSSNDEKYSYKRPCEIAVGSSLLKRRKASIISEPPRQKLQRSVSENAATTLSSKLSNSYGRPDLIADFSRPYVLPFVPNPKHIDLTCISVDTLAAVMRGEFNNSVRSYTIIDCRYPYEYEGGHIRGSLNLYTCELIESVLINEDKSSTPAPEAGDSNRRDILIFHCEFSLARGPSMYRWLRRLDRRRNTYPELKYPEVYLLQGGYQVFQESHSLLCDPIGYQPMVDPKYEADLRKYRSKSSSFGGNRANVKRLQLL